MAIPPFTNAPGVRKVGDFGVLPAGGGLRPLSDATGANFRITDAAGNNIFHIDTTNRRVSIEPATSGQSFTIKGSTSTRFMQFVASTSTLELRVDDNSALVNPTIMNAGMTGTNHGCVLRFRLGRANTPNSNTAEIRVLSENTWTSTASTQNAFMAFYTSAAGAASTEKLRITSAGVLVHTSHGGLRWNGYKTNTADPTTTDLPTSLDVAIFKNTTSGSVFLAYNDGGVIKKVALT